MAILASNSKSCQTSSDRNLIESASSFERNLIEAASSYGANIGMAFQLVDDWLDFAASAEQVYFWSDLDMMPK